MKWSPKLIVAPGLAAALSLAAACGGTEPPRSLVSDEADVGSSAVTPWSAEAYEATDMAFLPDGSALVLTKGGWKGPGIGLVTLLSPTGAFVRDVLSLPVCSDAERGLLGIRTDPEFPSRPFVYVFYTAEMNECAVSDLLTDRREPVPNPVWNRLSRFTFDGEVIDPDSEVVLVDEIPGHQSSHNGGGLAFGPDGDLLVSIGEGTYARSRERNFVSGKLLRIDVADGDATPSARNPFVASTDEVEQLVYALGFRNPFRVAVAADGTIAVGDVGTDEFEEINIVEAGGDYGYPDVEGMASDDGSLEPEFVYPHEDGCMSVIMGDAVPPSFVGLEDATVFTFSDLGCGGVWAMSRTTGDDDWNVTRLAGPLGYGLAALRLGPDGRLYLVGIGSGAQRIAVLEPAQAPVG